MIAIFALLVHMTAMGDPTPTLLQTMPPEKALLNETIELKPIAQHHFNLKAPQRCGSFAWAKSTPELQSCTVSKAENFTITVSICDDKESFCETNSYPVTVIGAKNKVSVVKAPHLSAEKFTLDANGFIEDNPVAALAQAKKKNQLVLVDFYGIWCPPCRGLEEYIFSKPDFKKALANVVKLRVDIDKPAGREFKNRYHVDFYPTLMVLQNDGEEIARRQGFGYQPVSTFVSWWTAIANQPLNIKDLRMLLVSSKEVPDDLQERMLTMLRAQNKWDQIAATASEAKDSSLKKKWQIVAAIGKAREAEDSNGERDALEDFVDLPKPDHHTLDYGLDLLALETNPSRKQKYGRRILEIVEKLEASPQLRDQCVESLPDVYETAAGIWRALGDKEKSKTYLRKAEQAWADVAAQGKNQLSMGPNMWRANLLLRLEDWETAAKILAPLAKAYPQEFTFHSRYAKALKGQKKYSEARKEAEVALKLAYGVSIDWIEILLADIDVDEGKRDVGKARLEKILSKLSLTADPAHRFDSDDPYVLEEVRAKLDSLRTTIY